MSLFFNSGCRTNCNCNCRNAATADCNCGNDTGCDCGADTGCGCGNNCGCGCTSEGSTQVAGAATEEPAAETVRALLTTVIDSCCTTDDVCREIEINTCSLFPYGGAEEGTPVTVTLNGQIGFDEVSRTKDGCSCVSTVRFTIPIRIIGPSGCGCPPSATQVITVIRSAKLCCTAGSQLAAYNTAVLASSGVVSSINADTVTISLCLLFRSCLQQTVLREYSWEATPICISDNCSEARKLLSDPCDTFCGCTAGSRCPSCG